MYVRVCVYVCVCVGESFNSSTMNIQTVTITH